MNFLRVSLRKLLSHFKGHFYFFISFYFNIKYLCKKLCINLYRTCIASGDFKTKKLSTNNKN